jgi:hypothetical protein
MVASENCAASACPSALHVRAAMQSAGQLEVPVANGARGLEHFEQFFVFQHAVS